MTVGTIIAVCAIAAGAFFGAKKGVLKMGVGFAGWIIVLIFMFAGTPYVNRFLTERTALEPFIYEKTAQYLESSSDEMWLRIAEGSGDAADRAVSESENRLFEDIRNKLPDSLNQTIDDIADALADGTEDALQNAKNAAGKAASEAIRENTASIASTWTGYIMQGISLLVTWLAARIVIMLLGAVIHVADKAPVIHGISHTLGAVLGVLISLLYMWAALVAAEIFALTSWGAQIHAWVEESRLLSWIAGINPLMYLLR